VVRTPADAPQAPRASDPRVRLPASLAQHADGLRREIVVVDLQIRATERPAVFSAQVPVRFAAAQAEYSN